MFGFGKEKSEKNETEKKTGLFTRLKNGLKKTRGKFTDNLARLIRGRTTIDDELLESLETQLLLADVGIETSARIIETLTKQVSRQQFADPSALLQELQNQLTAILAPCNKPLVIPDTIRPFVILMVGVNGVGKTTTIGKLAKQYQEKGLSVMLAAGDTFRAAAVEQLQKWGERNAIPVISQQSGADSASVLFDALQAAQARQIDVLIADTAGRLHTQQNLMTELKKITRVLAKLDPNAPHEIMLVIDAGTGQNALSQAKTFHEDIGVTGITITKLDGTAKGGIIFAVADAMAIPIRYIGVGEDINDLRDFDATDFIQALFAQEQSKE